MDSLIEYLPFILPLLLVQLSLGIFSAIHVWKHPHYRFGNRRIWIFIVLVIQIIGPILYFAIGKGDE